MDAAVAESTDDVLRDRSTYEEMLTLIDETMRDISGTSITNSNAVVDVLLDIRNGIEKITDLTIHAVGMWLQYREVYGELDDAGAEN